MGIIVDHFVDTLDRSNLRLLYLILGVLLMLTRISHTPIVGGVNGRIPFEDLAWIAGRPLVWGCFGGGMTFFSLCKPWRSTKMAFDA